MANDTLLTDAQASRLRKALCATTGQIHLVEGLLIKLEVPPTPESRLAMLQVLATNYLAERNKGR